MRAPRGTGNRLPTPDREIAELRREISKLWAALAQRPPFPSVQEFIPFSWYGTVSGTRTSGPFSAPARLTITQGTLEYTSAGGSTTTVGLYVAGVLQHTFTLAAGSTKSVEQVRIRALAGDKIHIVVSGGGGTSLTANFNFVREATAL